VRTVTLAHSPKEAGARGGELARSPEDARGHVRLLLLEELLELAVRGRLKLSSRDTHWIIWVIWVPELFVEQDVAFKQRKVTVLYKDTLSKLLDVVGVGLSRLTQ
jgi:hypothetical protein